MSLKDKYVKVEFSLKINGNLITSKETTFLERTQTGGVFSLDKLAEIMFLYERILGNGSTFAQNVLKEYEGKLPAPEGETSKTLFDKYWTNYKSTMESMFEVENNGGAQKLFSAMGQFAIYAIYQQCEGLETAPLQVKQGFLYWFFKYYLGDDILELHNQLSKIPQFVKDIVDNEVMDNSIEE